MSRINSVAGFLCAVFLGLTSSVHADDADLALRTAKILNRYCYRCHRGAGSTSGFEFDVRDLKTLIGGDSPVITAGKSDKSILWQLMHRGTMPPKSQPQLSRPTPEEAQIVENWIKAGAPAFPVAKPREFVSLAANLQAIRDDLNHLRDEKVRKRQRYFTLTALHNNSNVTDDTLTLARAGLAKALNSLSWERELVIPRAVDKDKLVFAVDIEALGWSRDQGQHWSAIRVKYPYPLGFKNLDDKLEENRKLIDLDREILQLIGHSEPLYTIRGDWLQAIATQPGLYHTLLYDLSLPELKMRRSDPVNTANPKHMTAVDLERYLKIDVPANILNPDERRIVRAGFTPSGVSGQNRMVERHSTPFGAYWKSYDFKGNNRRAILSQFPLGPDLLHHPFPALVFKHDGGEIVFHLPNGLQGYMLIDGKDNRIDAGPIEVVSDALKTSGTPAIVNGLSCIACHKQGMVEPPDDELRKFARVFDKPRDLLQRLYPETSVMQNKVSSDRRQFMTSLESVIGPFLRIGDDAKRPLEEFSEPVSEVARGYLLEELDLATVAAELYEPDDKRLRAKIENDELLKGLGLGVLLREGGTIKRAFWDNNQDGNSVMQLTGSTLDYSTPRFGN